MGVTPLTAARDSKVEEGRTIRYLMLASTTIYKGGNVGLVAASGLARPITDTASERFVGIAEETVTSDGSTAAYVLVRKNGVHRMAWWDDDAVANADIGAEVYAASDSEVCSLVHPNGTNHSNNSIKVGRLAWFEGTVPFVRIDGYT